MKDLVLSFLEDKIKAGMPPPPTEQAYKSTVNLLIDFAQHLKDVCQPQLNPVTVFQLVKHRWDFKEQHIQANPEIQELRWTSQVIECDDEQFWLELELGKPGPEKKHPYVAICWLNWMTLGKQRFISLPNISRIQSIEGLQAFLSGLMPVGQLPNPRTEAQAFEHVMQHKSLLGKYDNTIKYL